MAEKFKDLIIEQHSTFRMIGRILPQFRLLRAEEVTAQKIQSRIEVLKEYWETARHLDVRLNVCKTSHQSDHDYFLNDEFLSAESTYMETLDGLKELLPSPPTAGRNSTMHDGSQRDISGVSGTVRLPQIEVPNYNGDPAKWVNFRDIFESLIVNNESLTNTQRLQYLKAYVSGEAALLIQHLKIADENYAGAWQILKDEYGNERDVVHAHIHAFAELPIMKFEAAKELKELRDVVSSSRNALQNLGRSVETWDDLLVYTVTQKFCPRTWQAWNLHLGNSVEYPTYAQLHDFLTLRVRGLAKNTLSDVSTVKTKSTSFSQKGRSHASVNNITTIRKCLICSGQHNLPNCPTFKRYSVEKRSQTARQARVCFNCLCAGHFPINCSSQLRCAKCQRAHHTLLHRETESEPNAHVNKRSDVSIPINAPNEPNLEVEQVGRPSTSGAFHAPVNHVATIKPAKVLLATAWVTLRTKEGRALNVRALLDQGSSYSFISESLAQILKAKRQRVHMLVTGFGEQYSGTVKSQIPLILAPCNNKGPEFPLNAYVFPKLTAYAASTACTYQEWPHLKHLALADPDPTQLQPIHLLIGADLYGSLLLNDLRQGPLGSPTAQLTVFGWIISGPTGLDSTSSHPSVPVMHCVGMQSTDDILQRFWEIENIPDSSHLSSEDQQCEDHFVDTHSRNMDGRYVVRLPFKDAPPIEIGQSFHTASSLYHKLEKRLANNSAVGNAYTEFLSEYEALGHMAVVPPGETPRSTPVYLPHHPVVRENSATTSLRVVFNASSRTTNGTSLNDHLLIGPKLQGDLVAIMMRWRQHRYVYTADIAKMFRCILLHREDVDFQRILWKDSIYRLLTVTYGTSPAPFIALRVLKQLAQDEGHLFPIGSQILQHSFYVDETFFGADDISSLILARSELNALLSRGGFRLRKWASNEPSLLRDIDPKDHGLAFDHQIDDTESLKVLGITWLPNKDVFTFKVRLTEQRNPTKRSILSFIARLYDPLGWATPIVITAKIIMQDLWLLKGGWDDPVTENLALQWQTYMSEFSQLSEFHIDRWTGQQSSNLGLELHGFADASSRAYAAAVYLRVQKSNNEVEIHLLIAKSKVAPLKTLSIPRLELCGAVLLTKLLVYARKALDLSHVPVYGWLDSTVAIAWIRQFPGK